MKRPIPNGSRLLVIGVALAWATTSLGGRLPTPSDEARLTERNLTRVTTNLLEQSQFSHHPLDKDLAQKWLDRYLDGLDPRHSLFLQSDVEEFAHSPHGLVQSIRGEGDASLAHKFFARYLERLEQQVDAMTAMLKTTKFEFTGHDTYSLDWEHAPRPRSLAAARGLWRQQLRVEYLQEKLGDKQPAQIAKVLTRRHTQQLKTMKGLTDNEVLETYLRALAQVYDPHSNYLGHEEMENMSISMNLSLFGIGASLQTVDGYCTIHELIAGGPAARSGLFKPGDRIVAVAQAKGDPVDVVNIPLTRTVELIRGPKGSTVTLTILPAGANEGSATKTVTLVRDKIKLEDQEAKASIVDLPIDKNSTFRLGVIDLPSFYADIGGATAGGRRSATADVAHLLTKLKAEHVRGVILDLRRNGGGSLEEAISLTGLFIRKGPVVQTRDPSGGVDVESDDDGDVLYDGPLVLLTSRFSASASEILAGALKDYGRAVIVGDTSTFGKGTVQSIVPLGRLMDQRGLEHAYDPGALLVTIRKFYRPSGASTQLRGVAADIVLPSVSDFADVSESSLHNPLPWDTVPSTRFEQLHRVKPWLSVLRDKSSRRVAADKGFGLLAESIARLKMSLASKSVSLNEAERRADMTKTKALDKDLEQERRRLRAKAPTTYEITLKNASSPGLPTPLVQAKDPPHPAPAAPGETPEDLDAGSADQTPADDIILNEAERVLADYVRLLAH